MSQHYHHSREALEKLAARLNKNQVGAPATRKMFELLSILYSEDEAFVGANFPVGPTTLNGLAKRVGRSPEKLKPILESMSEKALVYERDVAGKRFYLLTPTLIGFIEFTLMRLDRDLPYKKLAELTDSMLDGSMGKDFLGSDTSLSRTLVQEKALDSLNSTILPYEKISDIIRSYGGGAVQHCCCRQISQLLGKSCAKKAPLDVCMSMGSVAEFLTRRGYARRASMDEMLKILDETEELGLVHITDNVRDDPQFICHCCGCCCEVLSGINRRGLPKSVEPSSFQVEVITEKCSGCGTCQKACQVRAISVAEDPEARAVVDKTRCIGCGICVSRCEKKALSLEKRTAHARIPRNYFTRHLALTWEKGRLHHTIGYLAGAALSGDLLDILKFSSRE